MDFQKLGRDAPISENNRTKSTEEMREMVASNDKGIKISRYKDVWRVALYRNTIKVAAIQIDGDLAQEAVREGVKQEIRNGSFDKELTEEYAKIYQARKAKKRVREQQ